MIGKDPRKVGPQVPENVGTRYPIEPDRIITVLLTIVGLEVGVITADFIAVTLPQAFRHVLLAPLWVIAAIYFLTNLTWLYEVIQGLQRTAPPIEYGPEEVQVRILTIDAEKTVQQTVDALPDELTDRHVIAETQLEIHGAEVHVVPDGFECTATDKGRALEWARRTIPCTKEYVLFLDEDTIITEFKGVPDIDVVQFREQPVKTGSWWTFWSEVFRMGWQLEQMGFAQKGLPLYTWGGGLAVRTRIEEEVTWNFDSLIEDSVFAWFAVTNGATFDVVRTRFRNQAPPSIRDMLQQRRRWSVGTMRDEKYLPFGYHVLITLRNVVWGLSPVLIVLTTGTFVLPVTIFDYLPLHIVSYTLAGFTMVWTWAGIRYYDGLDRQTLPVIPLMPVLVGLHSLGTLWGLVSGPQEFHHTETAADGHNE